MARTTAPQTITSHGDDQRDPGQPDGMRHCRHGVERYQRRDRAQCRVPPCASSIFTITTTRPSTSTRSAPSGSCLTITHDAAGQSRRALSRRLQRHGARASRHRLSAGRARRAARGHAGHFADDAGHARRNAGGRRQAVGDHERRLRARARRTARTVHSAGDAAPVRSGRVGRRSSCARSTR